MFFFNYRSDRMREIATVFGQLEDVVDTKIPKDLVMHVILLELLSLTIKQEIATMSAYKVGFPFKVAFPPQKMDNVLAEWLSKQGLKQCHIAGESGDQLSCVYSTPLC